MIPTSCPDLAAYGRGFMLFFSERWNSFNAFFSSVSGAVGIVGRISLIYGFDRTELRKECAVSASFLPFFKTRC